MRRRSRECAVQILYQLDVQDNLNGAPVSIQECITDYWLNLNSDVPVEREFTERLVLGVTAEVSTLDEAIMRAAVNWRIDRMQKVDRNVMRLAAYEMLFCPDIPPKVSIDEALEVSKRFSSSDAAGFINGVLDALRTEVENDAGRGDSA